MDSIANDVQNFYNQLPFNYSDSATQQTDIITNSCQISAYEPLHQELIQAPKATRVLDAGCGTGWFTLSIAHWYKLSCHGIDFTETALDRAKIGSELLNLSDKTTFSQEDLLSPSEEFQNKRFDIVNSIGVLHHTSDCHQAFLNIAELLENDGIIHIGLYHEFGRKPLLDKFDPFRKAYHASTSDAGKRESEDSGFALWKEITSDESEDETFSRSWFRDQCLHPHETQWLLADVLGWFDEAGIEPTSTSLNRYAPNPDWSQILDSESDQQERALDYMSENKFFPGFFMVSGRKF